MLKSQVKKKVKMVLINFKVTARERELLVKKAKRYTDGNVTALLKYSVFRLSPRSRDIVRKTG